MREGCGGCLCDLNRGHISNAPDCAKPGTRNKGGEGEGQGGGVVGAIGF